MIRNEWANAHTKISSMFTYKSVTLILQQNKICQENKKVINAIAFLHKIYIVYSHVEYRYR